MNYVREYRTPVMIGAGSLVVALLLWAILIAPQNSKLSGLQAKATALQTQQSTLQGKLSSLKSEQAKLVSSCADLQKIATQIPSVQTPTDVDAEESSFESQFNALTSSTGVALTQFSGFAPATATGAAPTTKSAVAGANVVAVPTTLAITGTFGQVLSFVNGLDNFPRLFVIQTFVLATGTGASGAGAGSGSGSSSSSSGSSGSASASATPLWVGGARTAAGAGPYALSITGSIYYTTTPNALGTCTKATEASKET